MRQVVEDLAAAGQRLVGRAVEVHLAARRQEGAGAPGPVAADRQRLVADIEDALAVGVADGSGHGDIAGQAERAAAVVDEIRQAPVRAAEGLRAGA